jgi:hypothetical protein
VPPHWDWGRVDNDDGDDEDPYLSDVIRINIRASSGAWSDEGSDSSDDSVPRKRGLADLPDFSRRKMKKDRQR